MKKLILPLLIVLLGGIFYSAYSAEPRLTKIRSMEGITEYRMNNGLKVLLFPDESKEVITVNITYLVGSRHENYGETGMAHLLEHLVFKGTPKYKNIPKELNSRGASFNGTTWDDRTNYYETLPATKENLEFALDFEADRMVNSFISKKDLDTEFSVVRNEFERGENNPVRVLIERIYSTAYLWHNYGKSTIGCRSDVENVPIDRLQAFYKKYYQPDNAVLTVAGKFDVAQAVELIKEKFGTISKPKRKLRNEYTVEPVQDGERSVVLRRTGGAKYIGVLYHAPAGYHEDFLSLTLLQRLLVDEPSGRVYKTLVDGKKATWVSGFAWQRKHPGSIFLFAEVSKDKDENDAMNTMLAEIKNIQTNPITQSELDRIRNKILKEAELYLSDSGKVGELISEYIAMGDWRLLFYSRDKLKTLTPENLTVAAKKYFIPSNSTTGKFIPTDKPVRAEVPLVSSPMVTLKDYKNTNKVVEGEAFNPSSENLLKRVKNQNKNNLHFSLLSKKTRNEIVHGTFIFKIGSEKSLHNMPLIGKYTASMLNKGTKTKSRQDIDDLLSKYKASLSFGYQPGTLTVRFQTNRENISNVLNLAEDILKNPSFPKEELDKIKEEDIADVEKDRKEPRGIIMVNFRKAISNAPKGHPWYTLDFDEELKAIKSINIESLKKFRNDFLGASNSYFSFAGDFDEDTIKKQITGQFENWKSKNRFKYIKPKYSPLSKVLNEEFITPDKKNAWFMGLIKFSMNDSSEDYIPLFVANYLLGGGALSSRLADRLRQKDGLCYGVGSFFNAPEQGDNGMIGMYAIYNPENLKKLELGFREEIERVRKYGFSKEELEKAKKGLLEETKVNRSKDGSLSSEMASYSFHGRTYKWDIEKEKKLKNVSLEEVNKAFNKYISVDKLNVFKAGDFTAGKVDAKKQDTEK